VVLADIQRVHFLRPGRLERHHRFSFYQCRRSKTIGMAVMEEKIDKASPWSGPPGHHAMRIVHGSRGFCNINIEAVMIEFLRRKLRGAAGGDCRTRLPSRDGTQDIYWHDPDTLFISLHQDGPHALTPARLFPSNWAAPTRWAPP